MLGTVIADERLCYLCFTGHNAWIAQTRQPLRISFSCKNSLHNRQAGGSRDIADDMMQLDVHLIERFLHVLNMDCRHLHETLSMSPKGAESTDDLRGTVGGAEKPGGVEVLQPLAIGDVGLAARHVLDMTGVDQANAKATVFQNLKERNPEKTRGFHNYAFDATLLEPVG